MKPLEGIKVIEFSTMITASFAAMMMAEQGASVTKVEPIELGDPMRFLGSNKGGISALFANFNRGKKSLRLDIKEEKGKEGKENQEEESLYNSITQTSQTLTLPAGVDLALNVKAFNAPSSSDESASQPNITAGYKVYGNSPQTTIIITGNMSGATKALNFVVASRIS